MAQYRKKQVVIIDAIIFTRNNWTEIQEFTGGRAHNLMIEKRINGIATCIIQTSSGSEIANEGDYIVRRVNGEYYSCKPYLFKMIYEPINQQQTMNDVEQETLKRGEEIIAYCKQYEGTDKYDVVMLAIEFGYQLALKSE